MMDYRRVKRFADIDYQFIVGTDVRVCASADFHFQSVLTFALAHIRAGLCVCISGVCGLTRFGARALRALAERRHVAQRCVCPYRTFLLV